MGSIAEVLSTEGLAIVSIPERYMKLVGRLLSDPVGGWL
jgi:hypothetical protein